MITRFRTLMSPSWFLWIAAAAMITSQAGVHAATPDATTEEVAAEHLVEVTAEGGKYRISIDTSGSPELSTWAKQELAPVLQEWYPTIVHMLPSKDYDPPQEVEIKISDDIEGVAYAFGNQVRGNGNWYKRNLEGEAKGSLVHELVHVVQQYGRGRRGSKPGWLVEGIPDYIRWFLYEPESGGALITADRADRARHDASYRTSANFINWVCNSYGQSLVPKLNARIRNGEYTVEFWEEYTGKPLDELAAAWKESLQAGADEQPAGTDAPENVNQLTDEEKSEGWKLLFNGADTEGWHSFKRDEVMPGWQVKDGKLVCADPRNAGDLCTDDSYEWFELKLEYNISQGGNSGIMFHVTNEGGAAWATGPEFQLEDNMEAHDPTRCGWLYALYQPPTDPDTDHPIDSTLPAGQWNQVRLLIAPDGCVHEINGVKYLEYQLGSDEFKERVAASKFASMPLFAKPAKGMVALQGDHGVVSFRNVKIRPITE
ncbi:Plant Basic Secretory Protein [Posidoniimonas corsicana]|uniref:Plant Basic Secretory Protein n=1 Tax=Posidoniimonas corsicana TaxID=1938618 RepID=A0A5C5UT89_9BACT|nr:family 16 glycoside hydrolase [Posidoniimonas corsicana]TWT29601.1 Plant Basic Secretory Protein [Posidoniimonas corsicana]